MGELHLIIGCMFSGKTTELLRIAKRLKSIDQTVALINYLEDTRYSTTDVTTHDKYSCDIESHLINDLSSLDVNSYSVICINEAQFFDGLKQFCMDMLSKSKIIYVSGLDGDFKQQPFGEILDLIPMCNTITRLHAFCKVCKNGNPAYFTKRLTNSKEQKLIGTDEYIPVCRKHLL
jgi:thymidine kinase